MGPLAASDDSIGIVGLDDRDGHRRWITPVLGPDANRTGMSGEVMLTPPVTDGCVLFVSLSADVAALGLQTGAVLWCAPLPSGHTEVTALGGLLIARTPDGSRTDVIG